MNMNGPQPINTSHSTDELLTLASLFDEDFSIDWIVELTSWKASIALSNLETLTKTGWLRRKKPGFYCFSNAKRSEIALRLSDEKKTELHGRISEILMTDAMDDNDKAMALFNHLKQIPTDIKGCRWLKKAGDLFLMRYDINHAIECYLKVIDELLSLDSDEAEMLFIETALRYSKISLAQQKTSKVLSILEMARTMAEKLNCPADQALLEMNMASNEWFLGNDEKTIRYFESCRKIAEKLHDHYALDKINIFSTFFYFHQGRYLELIEWYEKFVPEVTRFPKDMFPLINVTIAGYAYAQTGQVSQAIGILDALLQHTKEIGDQYMEVYALGTIGSIWLDIGKKDEALLNLEHGMMLAAKVGNRWEEIGISVCLACCHYLMGNENQAIVYLRQFTELCNQYEFVLLPQLHYLIMLCWGIEEGRLPTVAGLSLGKVIHRCLSTQNYFLRGVAYRYQALLERRNDAGSEKIMKLLNLSLEALNKSGSTIETAKTQLEMTRQYLFIENEKLAIEMVRQASIVLSPLNKTLIPDDLKPLCIIEERSGDFLLAEILKLGQDIANIRESKALILRIITAVNCLTGAERGALFLKIDNELKLKASKNITSQQISHISFLPSLKIIEEVAKTGRGVIKGIKNDDRKDISYGETIRSIICVPMMLRTELKGVLYHDNRLLGSAFNESDLNLLAYFAALAAIALENVTSYEAIHAENQRLSEEKKYFEEQYLEKMSEVNIVGKCIPIKRVLKQISQVAQTDANVLILGDTGVGKELVACSIHHNSLRKQKPFVCVQCSALPEKLLPSELFGYEKGAFTGAVKRKLGRFELANGGTIFLDEIGELSPDMQVQLLRVLETRQFERIGGTATIQSDFRLIAATNRDLKKEVEGGRFRQDLFYRLNVFPIHVPSLKERGDDIILLINYFAEQSAKKLGKVYDRISKEDIIKLLAYDWPGNVRELQNLVERAIIIHHGAVLKLLSGPIPSVPQTPIDEPVSEGIITLHENERRLILQALQKTNWKVSGPRGAANLLNIKSSTLNFRMKKLGIKRPIVCDEILS
jgi:transcriptional regulator with GAF, ATPase, and Fis domain